MTEHEALKNVAEDAFIIAVSGDGNPYVKVQFRTITEMQRFHASLYHPSNDFQDGAEVMRDGIYAALHKWGGPNATVRLGDIVNFVAKMPLPERLHDRDSK